MRSTGAFEVHEAIGRSPVLMECIVVPMSQLRKQSFTPLLTKHLPACFVCQWLSNCYKNIHLFRFDVQTGDVYILAGDELQIIVPPNGLWDFL